MARWSGKDRLVKRMRATPSAVRKALRAQNAANAEELVATMKGYIAVDEGVAKATVKAEDVSDATKISQKVSAGGPETTTKVRKSEKGNAPDYDYVNAIEHGTSDMPAQPFFWPAWRQKRRLFKRRMSAAARKAIKNAK